MSEKKKKVREEASNSKATRSRTTGHPPVSPTGFSAPEFSKSILEAARSLEGRSFSSIEEKREALVDRVVDLVGGPPDQREELRDFLLLLIETDPRMSEWE